MSVNLPFWGTVSAVLWVSLGLWTAWHTLLTKKRPQAKLAWLGLIALAPLLGAGAYLLFGIDRVGKRATIKELRNRAVRGEIEALVTSDSPWRELPREGPGLPGHLKDFAVLLSNVSRYRAVPGNRVDTIDGGDEWFPRVLGVIESAQKFVVLETFIFDSDAIGEQVLQALRRAARRGVRCSVLYDAVGSPHLDLLAVAEAQGDGVQVSPFASRSLLKGRFQLNLRNHRKILVVDGRVGFTGGMNITARHSDRPGVGVESVDYHFELRGPVVHQLTAAFAEDWYWATGERLVDPLYFPKVDTDGDAICRVLPSGPDGDVGVWHKVLVTAIHNAQRSVRIASPYFIPDEPVMMALVTAALRGVRVDLVIPQKTDHKVVDWAMRSFFGELLAAGVGLYLRDGPMLHAKLLVIDDLWACIGSANVDPRSFALNYELNVGVTGEPAVSGVSGLFDAERDASQRLSAVRWKEERSVIADAWSNLFALFGPLL